MSYRVDRFCVSLVASMTRESNQRRLTLVYGPTDGALFGYFIDELDSIRAGSSLPWCVGMISTKCCFQMKEVEVEGTQVGWSGLVTLWTIIYYRRSSLEGQFYLV